MPERTTRSEAEKAYNAALALDPDNEDALTGLAMVYANNWATPKGHREAEGGHRQESQPLSLISGRGVRNSKDIKDAADALSKALEMQPEIDRLARGWRRI